MNNSSKELVVMIIFAIIGIYLWTQIDGLKKTIADCNQRIIADAQTIANAGGDISDAKSHSNGTYQEMQQALNRLNGSLPQQLQCGSE